MGVRKASAHPHPESRSQMFGLEKVADFLVEEGLD